MNPFFSIIIPTCNRNDFLARCLNYLDIDVQKVNNFLYEIIVTDDSNENIAQNFIAQKYPWVQWLEGPKRGPAANRNNGAKYAKGEWLIFLDDDCEPLPTLINEYLYLVESKTFTLVFEGAILATRPKNRFDEEAPINIDGGKLWSCNFCIKKSFFSEINGFDECFLFAAMEDVDMKTRIEQFTVIEFAKNAAVVHPWRRAKPFSSINKHIQSHIVFSKKYNYYNTFKYRWSRCKIFVGSIPSMSLELFRYSFKGWLFFLDRIWLNFLLIFY